MHVIRLDDLEAIEEAYFSQAVAEFAIAAEALVFDGTNLHTFIASTNDRAPIAQRGRAKNKRFDLRLAGLTLACSTDHRTRSPPQRLRATPRTSRSSGQPCPS